MQRLNVKWIAVMLVLLLLQLAGCEGAVVPGEEVITRAEEGIIVVGAGAAGLAASIEAAKAGSTVLLLEKLPMAGGSMLCSGGTIYAAESPVQQREGVVDSAGALADFWLEEAQEMVDTDLVHLVAQHSGETIGWLEGLGAKFTLAAPLDADPFRRSHQLVGGRGAELVKILEGAAKDAGVEILLETRAQRLLTDAGGTVVGLEAVDKEGKTITYSAQAVVLATGGFDRNEELLAQYSPSALEIPINFGRVGNVGDGLIMAREVGADIVAVDGALGCRGVEKDMPYTHPLGALGLTPSLCVNSRGERFVCEDVDCSCFYRAMQEDGDSTFYTIFSAASYDPALEEALEKGLAYRGNTLGDLAAAAGIDKDGLEETVANYNRYVAQGQDAQFARDISSSLPTRDISSLLPIDDAPFYALRILPATRGTIGGPRINHQGQVIDTEGELIPGLYAAGEVANGQFFPGSCPATGTSLQYCLTLGRIAGKAAVGG